MPAFGNVLMACDSITAVTSAGPRAPGRKDYQRVALAAAQQTAQAQAQARVLVLEADDRIADAESHLQQAAAGPRRMRVV